MKSNLSNGRYLDIPALRKTEHWYDVCSMLSDEVVGLHEVEYIFEYLLSSVVQQDGGVVGGDLVAEL